MKQGNKLLSVLLTFAMLAALPLLAAVPARAEEDAMADAYANQWARSDVRAWLNGLTKTAEGSLPVDGSNGTKSEGNFLNCFTDAELALFRPQAVTTVTFNDAADSDDIYFGTTGEVRTCDRFWLPSGNYNDTAVHLSGVESYLLSADPACDLSDGSAYAQKIDNGGGLNNVIPVPYWGSGYSWLRSGAYEDGGQALYATCGTDISCADVDWEYNAHPCAAIELPSACFAATAAAVGNTSGSLSAVQIKGYDKLGVRQENVNYMTPVPSWGIYLKQISLDGISGSLECSDGTLTFTSATALPRNKYLMVQAYTDWDSGINPTENAREEDRLYVAGKEIENDNTTQVAFTLAGGVDLSGYRVKVWVEEPADNDRLARASAPLSFAIDGNGVAASAPETTSGNPRVFAYRSDLDCAWGALSLEGILRHTEYGVVFDESFLYAGAGATWQKLYLGTNKDGSPLEWWIVSRDNTVLTLYEASSSPTTYQSLFSTAFNAGAESYEGSVRNPSLALADNLTDDDLADVSAKVTLSYGGNELTAPADAFSVQFCKAGNGKMTGTAWTDDPDGAGEFCVRAAFAGGKINGTSYAPCFSNVRSVTLHPVAQVGGTEYTAVQSAIDAALGDSADAAGTVTLTADVETAKTLTIPEGKFVTLDLNDHVILFRGDNPASGSAIWAEYYSGLTLTDGATVRTERYITLDESGRGVAVSETAPESGEAGKDWLAVSGGVITGGCAAKWAGGVMADCAVFTMAGGTIAGCVSGSYGGGVFVGGEAATGSEPIKPASFTMTGGTIVGNRARAGGGVSVNHCTFEMENTAAVSDNTADYGGGVYVFYGTFRMLGSAAVSGNTVKEDGGGVYAHASTLEMGDTAVVSGNTAVYGGGVYSEGTFTMSGGASVSGNVKGGTITNGRLTGGTQDNVVLPSGAVITVTGALTGTVPTGVAIADWDDNKEEFVHSGGVFAAAETGDSGENTYNNGKLTASDAAHFVSDNSAYRVRLNGDGEAYLDPVYKVTFSTGDGGLTATFSASAGSLLIAASYEDSGKQADVMVYEVTSDTIDGNHTFDGLKTGSGYHYKVMLVDKTTYAPLCAARKEPAA